MKRKHASSGANAHRDGGRPLNLERLPTAVVCILQCLGPRDLARTLRTSAWLHAVGSRDSLWLPHCASVWPCVAESPALKPLVTGGGAAGLYRRLQCIEVAAPAEVAPQAATRDVVPLDPREVSLLLRLEQGGDIVHSSVHALSAVLGEEVCGYSFHVGDERLAGLPLTSAMHQC
jgi:hypothetical protein